MAEEKDKLGNELMDLDFLGDMQSDISGMPTNDIYDKLAKLGAQQRMQPLVNIQATRSIYQPVVKMIENAEEQIAAGMVAYTLANPDIDNSKLYEGTGDLVTNQMTENNAKFKELNRKLGYMSPQHPDYAKTVAEIAKINETSVNFRDDNKKLLNIRNTIKDLDVQEMSKGQTPGEKMMYSDILTGNKENFQNIDGKLYWVNPTIDNENDPNKKISVESINANGPTMTDDAAFDQHYNIMNAVRKTKAEDLSDQDLNYQVNNMFKAVGNDGIKSLIFDSENSDMEGDNMVAYSSNGMMFNTAEWFESYYNDLGISPQSEEAQRIRLAIQNNGVMHSENGIRVKEHFRDWYSNKLKEVEKVGDGKPTSTINLDDPVDDPELKDQGSEITPVPVDISDIAPPMDSETNIYQGQSGSGKNYGNATSPFAGITQYGWAPESDPSGRVMDEDDHLFDYGRTLGITNEGKYVVNTLNREYDKYGFKFTNVTNTDFSNYDEFFSGDVLEVTYEHPDEGTQTKRFEFDNNYRGTDERNAKALQAWMESMIGWTPSK